MKIFNTRAIRDFAKQHADARPHLSNWLKETEEANWHSPNEIKAQYATASILSDNRIVFNIKGNSYRLLVHIHYQHGYVTILRIGTHSEYDKWKL